MPVEIKKNFVINAAFYAIIAVIVIALYRYILPIMTPFIIGFCIASVVQIPLNRIRLKHPKRKRGLALVFCVLFYAVVVSLLILVGYAIVREVQTFIAALPGLFRDTVYPFLMEMAGKIEELLAPINPELTEQILEMGKSAVKSLGQFATDLSAGAVKLVASGAVSIPGIIVQIVITVVSSFFIAADYRLVLDFLKKLIPDRHRAYVIQVTRYAEQAVLVYIKSYSLLFLITFVELWIGLSILKIPYALAIGLGIAVFDLMPVLGTGGILLPWAAVLLVMGNFPLSLGILLLYIIITAVRNTLEPKIVGEQIGLHPLATLVAMVLGLQLAGLLGMILFPITLVAVTNLRKTAEETPPQE